MPDLDHAVAIARTAHAGQKDKVGGPFFDHVERVARHVEGETAQTIAYLHDVVEKGEGWTFERLRDEGFPAAIISAVDALTRRAGEVSDDFTRRAAANFLARSVKRADLEDNLRQAQQAGIDTGKYRRGLAILNALEKE